jgi:hypothetical protein
MGAYWDGISWPRHGGDRGTPEGPESCGRPAHNTAVRLSADQRPPSWDFRRLLSPGRRLGSAEIWRGSNLARVQTGRHTRMLVCWWQTLVTATTQRMAVEMDPPPPNSKNLARVPMSVNAPTGTGQGLALPSFALRISIPGDGSQRLRRVRATAWRHPRPGTAAGR